MKESLGKPQKVNNYGICVAFYVATVNSAPRRVILYKMVAKRSSRQTIRAKQSKIPKINECIRVFENRFEYIYHSLDTPYTNRFIEG